jgi:hypothetical protein
MPIYFLLQVLQVKYASGSPELCINLCVSTNSVVRIFSVFVREDVWFLKMWREA